MKGIKTEVQTAEILSTQINADFAKAIKGLPDGYNYISYIRNPSKAYIDTGFRAEGGMKMAAIVRYLDYPAFGPGSHNSENDSGNEYNRNMLLLNEDGYISFDKCDVFHEITIKNDGLRHTFFVDNVGLNHICVIDGYEFRSKQTRSILHPVNNIIMGMNEYKKTFTTSTEFYYLELWDNSGRLVRNMVSCEHDGIAGMYDLVEGRFYHSSTDVEFVGGVIVNILLIMLATSLRKEVAA